jgi:hypothetical protein
MQKGTRMSSTERVPTGPGAERSVDVLDRSLREASTSTGTRRWLLERAAMGAAGVAAASAVIPTGEALASSHGDQINEWGVFASTTEALTVTITNELVRRASKHPEVPSSVSVIFDAVYAAERDHWLFTSRHWRPATTRFWIPDGFFGGAGDALDLTAVGKSVAGGEHLFVNTYLIGVTTFAAAGRSTYARYAAELAADESEHRVLGQSLAGASPPNDLGFAEFEFVRVSQIAAAAKSAGFGFGEQGTAAGRFYDLPRPLVVPRVQIGSNEPR